jgi:hypothetical protein
MQTWIAPVPEPVTGPLVGPDQPMLVGYLDWQRWTLLDICAGLTGEQLVLRPAPPSTLSLLGLVRHMTKVERTWLRLRVALEAIPPFFDPELGKDFDFDGTEAVNAEADFAAYERECRLADAAAAGIGFEHTIVNHGYEMSLRMVYLHLIGEYARHNGHADLLRQRIDGVTGR